MALIPFRERLTKGPVLCDGALGTLLDLYEYPEQPREIHNIRNPDIVRRIHTEYVNAGADLIQTNTFSGNRARLSAYHLEEKLQELNTRGVELAREAAGKNVYVAGSVGPTGKLLEPIGKLRQSEAREIFTEQIRILIEAGVDVLMLETFVSLQELDLALEVAKSLTDIPIIAQKTFPEDGAILSGTFPVEVVEHLMSKGADVIGANCTVGPQRMFSIIKSMYKEGVYLSAQPAAGIPTLMNGRALYHTSPEYLGQYARELLQSGVTVIGACCGSTPSHIAEMRKALDSFQKNPVVEAPAERRVTSVRISETASADSLRDDRSRFAKSLGKRLLTSVELDIPRGLDMSSVIDGARFLNRHGIDAINITDGARARLRMSSIALSSMIQREVGIETMMHLATRDRNMIGLQAELLGAHALGLRNVLFITGDPTNIGDYPQATSVFDIDSSGLIRAAKAMNRGEDLMGNDLGQRTSFLVACAANAMASNMDAEIAKLEKKVEAGADLIYTQPIYRIDTLEGLLRRIEGWKIPVMVGVLPLRSYKHAEFLHNEIPGMTIPGPIRDQLRRAEKKAGQVGVDISVEFLQQAKGHVAGVYLMPPFKKYEIVPEILDAIGIRRQTS